MLQESPPVSEGPQEEPSASHFSPIWHWVGFVVGLGLLGGCIYVALWGGNTDWSRLTKAPPGSNGFDAITSAGKTVQIKANHAASQIGYRGEADLIRLSGVMMGSRSL